MASSSSALALSKPPNRPILSSSTHQLSTHCSNIKSFKTPRRILRINSMARADFDLTLFDRGLDGTDSPPPGSGLLDAEDKDEPQCPPGLRKYETMVVLRPDMSEDERLAFTQKYEELLVAGGGMYVEVFNRGVIPLAYSIRKKNKAGETNTYMDGIYLLFTYFTKPDSLSILTETLLADDDVIRSSNFKVRKRKY